MELIRTLTAISQQDLNIAGGKGANLGELTRAGFPVPPGFVLLTSAYQHFISTNGLLEEIERLTQQTTLHDLASFERASQAIRALFAQSAIPEEIAQASSHAYQQPGATAVAIRSSATTEDLAGASFAGMHESYLNVHTLEDVLVAVRQCWSSLWTPRALSYRARLGIAPRIASMAVIVQQMVQASASGVLFTVDPVNGVHDEVVINATWGSGEALVSGQITPDTCTVEKSSGRIKQREVGRQTLIAVPTGSRTSEIGVETARQQQFVLTDEQVTQLVRFGEGIEEHFGVPQDIEWAIAGEQVFIVQARPITTQVTVQPAPGGNGMPVPPGDDEWDRENDLPPQPFDLWTRTNVGENLPFPITPLTATNFPTLFKLDETSTQQGTPTFQGTRRLYGRLYINEGAIIPNVTGEYGIPASFMDRTWGSRRRGNQQRNETLRPLRLLRKLPLLLRQGLAMSKQQEPKQTPEEFFAQIDQWVGAFMQLDLSLLDDRALWAEGLPVWRERSGYAFSMNLRVSAPSGIMYALLERIVRWWTGRKETAHKLVTGLPGGNGYNSQMTSSS
ncbi:MAG: PEP/pyruvate-binding domain-containing protein [Ktedonobacteraceae bacterium]